MFYNSTFVQELQDCASSGPSPCSRCSARTAAACSTQSITDAGPSFESTAAIGGWPQNPDNRSPYSTQWNLFIQRQLQDDLTLDIGYVGSASRKQIGYSPFNNALTPGPWRHQPAPPADRFRRSRRRLQPVRRRLQLSAGLAQEALLERLAVQHELHVGRSRSTTSRRLAENQKTQDPFNRRVGLEPFELGHQPRVRLRLRV